MRWIPNALTASRLILLLPIMLLLRTQMTGPAHWLAFALFVIAGATDFLDGWAARRFHCASSIGIYFDPLVDKVFANVILVFLACRYPAWIPLWMVLLLLVREFIVQGFRSMAPCKGVVLRTEMLNKLKLVFQLLAAGAALAGLAWSGRAAPLRTAAWALLGVALVFGYLSMGRLLWKNRDLWERAPAAMEMR